MALEKNSNLKSLRLDKSRNIETHYFLTKGRISLKAFLLRLGFVLVIIAIAIYGLWEYGIWFIQYLEEHPNDSVAAQSFVIISSVIYLLVVVMLVFLLIQMVKRVHDVNRSGWNVLIPLYNLYLVFSPGDKIDNDYGVNPVEDKTPYFIEEENLKNN
ncbi:DUF805 domain-containing protein [Flavobacteriaceae bacterium Ap0902]|nr:DUF805 domain-containing protein [Flavobacteriaceae bacterium Ap0902]